MEQLTQDLKLMTLLKSCAAVRANVVFYACESIRHYQSLRALAHAHSGRFFTHNVLLIAHTSRGHIAHTYRGHVDHVCTTVTLLVHTGVTLSVMPAADRGIHVQEADKQKPSVLELLAHFRSCVAAKAKLFPGEGQKQLLERVIKEYNSLMKVFPRWKLSTVLL